MSILNLAPLAARSAPRPSPAEQSWLDEWFGAQYESDITREDAQRLLDALDSGDPETVQAAEQYMQQAIHKKRDSKYEEQITNEWIDPLGVPQLIAWLAAKRGKGWPAVAGAAMSTVSALAHAPQAAYDIYEGEPLLWEGGWPEFMGGEGGQMAKPLRAGLEALGAKGDVDTIRMLYSKVTNPAGDIVPAYQAYKGQGGGVIPEVPSFLRPSPRPIDPLGPAGRAGRAAEDLTDATPEEVAAAINRRAARQQRARGAGAGRRAKPEPVEPDATVDPFSGAFDEPPIGNPFSEAFKSVDDVVEEATQVKTPPKPVEPVTPVKPIETDPGVPDFGSGRVPVPRGEGTGPWPKDMPADTGAGFGQRSIKEPTNYKQAEDMFNSLITREGWSPDNIEKLYRTATASPEQVGYWNRFKKEQSIAIGQTPIQAKSIDPIGDAVDDIIPTHKITGTPEDPGKPIVQTITPPRGETPQQTKVDEYDPTVQQRIDAEKPLDVQLEEGAHKLVQHGFTAKEAHEIMRVLNVMDIPIPRGVDAAIDQGRRISTEETLQQQVFRQAEEAGLDPLPEFARGAHETLPDVARSAKVQELYQKNLESGWSHDDALEMANKHVERLDSLQYPGLNRNSVGQMEHEMGARIPEHMRSKMILEEIEQDKRIKMIEEFGFKTANDDLVRGDLQGFGGSHSLGKTGTTGTESPGKLAVSPKAAAKADQNLVLRSDHLVGEQGQQLREFATMRGITPQVFNRAARNDQVALREIQEALYPNGEGIEALMTTPESVKRAIEEAAIAAENVAVREEPETLLKRSKIIYDMFKGRVGEAKHAAGWARKTIQQWGDPEDGIFLSTFRHIGDEGQVYGDMGDAYNKAVWKAAAKEFRLWNDNILKSNPDMVRAINGNIPLQEEVMANMLHYHAVQMEMTQILNKLGLSKAAMNSQWKQFRELGKHDNILPDEFVARQMQGGSEFIQREGLENVQRGLEVFGDAREAGLHVSHLKKMVEQGHHNIEALTLSSAGNPRKFQDLLNEYTKALREIGEETSGFNLRMGVDPTMAKRIIPGIGKAAAPTLGGLAGGATGSALYQDADPEGTPMLQQKQFWAMLAGVGAGMAAPGALKTLAKKPGFDAVMDATYFNILQKPATMSQAASGAIGGATVGAMEQILTGLIKIAGPNSREGVEQVGKGFKVLGHLFDLGPEGGAAVWKKALTDPEWARSVVLEGAPGRVHQRPGVLGLPGRVFTAFDAAAVSAMKKGGYTAEDATRFTLAGNPASKTGQQVLEVLTGQSKYEKLNPLAKLAVLFPRVGVLAVEGAIQRSPLGLTRAGSAGASVPRRLARQVTGAGAGYVGHEKLADPDMDPSLAGALAPFAGPAIIPAMAGFGLRRARQRGGPAIREMLQELVQMSPLGAQPLRFFTDPVAESQRRMVPGLLADTAEALDPEYGRVTGPAELMDRADEHELKAAFGPLRSMIPGLREGLPVRDVPVDVFGDPRLESLPDEHPARFIENLILPRQEWLAPPAQNIMDVPDLKKLHEIEPRIQLTPPSGKEDIPGLTSATTIPTSKERRAEVQKGAGSNTERAINLLVNDVDIQQMMTDFGGTREEKEMLLRMVLGMLQSAGRENLTPEMLMRDPSLIDRGLGR